MESAQNGFGTHDVIGRKAGSVRSQGCGFRKRFRNARSKTLVRTPLFIVHHPFNKDAPQVTLAERNQEVQALTTNLAHESFAPGIRPRRPKPASAAPSHPSPSQPRPCPLNRFDPD